MRLTFLGTGSAMPTGERFQSGLLLRSGDDALLVDCGSGVLHALERTDVGYEGVDGVLLSHHHLDHVSDLLSLCKARWLAGAGGLPIVGPPGTPELVEDLLDVHEYMQGRIDLDLQTVDGACSLAGFTADAREVRHSMQCFGYRIRPTAGAADARDGGADESADAPSTDELPTVVYSGDTEAFEEFCAFADGADVLVHDCSFPDDVDVDNHPTPSSLGRALASADPDVGTVFLTHRYPHTEGREEEMLESLGAHYDGDIRFAREGKTIRIE